MGSIPVRCNCHPSVNVLVLRSLSALCSQIVNQFLTKEYCYSLYLHQGSCEHRWCSGSIVAVEGIYMGSIPVRCNCHPSVNVLVLRSLSALCSQIVNQFLTKEYCYSLYLHQSSCEHRWCSVSIVPFQAIDMGSILVRCNCDSLAIVWCSVFSLHFFSPIVNQFLTQEDCFSSYNHKVSCEHRWCSGSIVAFQAIDMGSIPVRCNCHPSVNVLVLRSLSALCSQIVNQFLTKEYCYSLYLHQGSCEHRWCSGSIVAFEAIDMGSIPVRCNCDPLATVLVQRFLSALFLSDRQSVFDTRGLFLTV